MIGGGSLVSRGPDGDKYYHRCILCLRVGEEIFFQKNNTIWYSFYSKSLAILKKIQVSCFEKAYFFERNPSFERFGKSYYFSRIFWQKWYNLGKTWTQMANIGERYARMGIVRSSSYVPFYTIYKARLKNLELFFDLRNFAFVFFKVVFRERYWLYCGQPVCFPNPTK